MFHQSSNDMSSVTSVTVNDDNDSLSNGRSMIGEPIDIVSVGGPPERDGQAPLRSTTHAPGSMKGAQKKPDGKKKKDGQSPGEKSVAGGVIETHSQPQMTLFRN